MTTPAVIQTTSLDFQSYRASLVTYLKSQPYFKDMDFAGSNISVLLDLLAYNTYMNASYVNLVGSEMFMDSSTLRESMVSHAKELNYTPKSPTSSMAYVDLKVTGSNLPDNVPVPKNYRVSGVARNGKTYNFFTNDALVLNPRNSYSALNTPVFEGVIVNETFVAASDTRYVLGSSNADISSLTVQVQVSNSNTANTSWNSAVSLFGVNNTANVFFVQGFSDFQYELKFGNGVIGRALIDGNIVRVQYRTTNAEGANGLTSFTAAVALDGAASVSCVLNTNCTSSFGGTPAESDTSIKFNASRYFATQGRAVTDTDYVTLLMAQFPTLASVTSYGGENAEPKQFGRILISAIPRTGTVLQDSMKQQMLEFLQKRMSTGLTPVIIDPDVYYVSVQTDVTYNVNGTTKTGAELKNDIVSAVSLFNSQELIQFGSDLRYSRLTRTIDDASPCFVSNDTQIQLTKKLYPYLGLKQDFAWTYGEPVISVSSSPFLVSLDNKTYSVNIEDDGMGALNIYADINGVSIVLVPNIGVLDYVNGSVKISALSPAGLFASGSIDVSAVTVGSDIIIDGNKVLQIDMGALEVTLNGIAL